MNKESLSYFGRFKLIITLSNCSAPKL